MYKFLELVLFAVGNLNKLVNNKRYHQQFLNDLCGIYFFASTTEKGFQKWEHAILRGHGYLIVKTVLPIAILAINFTALPKERKTVSYFPPDRNTKCRPRKPTIN